jgi:hypothetical protein
VFPIFKSKPLENDGQIDLDISFQRLVNHIWAIISNPTFFSNHIFYFIHLLCIFFPFKFNRNKSRKLNTKTKIFEINIKLFVEIKIGVKNIPILNTTNFYFEVHADLKVEILFQ